MAPNGTETARASLVPGPVYPADSAKFADPTADTQELVRFLQDVEQTIIQIRDVCVEVESESDIDGVLVQAQLLLRDAAIVENMFPPNVGEAMVDVIGSIVREVQTLVDRSTLQRIRRRGRQPIPIHEEQLRYLLEVHFSTGQIACMLHVSPRTIRRRIIQYGLQEEVTFSEIDDDSLDAITSCFVDTHPNCGERSLSGFLRSSHLRIQRQRVRDSLMRVDPRGVQLRFRQVLHRRHYNVPMPNSLWHIDGYHRLIRWRIVIHGGIDGYSRLPVFLQTSTNNLAATVLRCFLGAVKQYGLPSRVRCDRGGENVLVSELMLSHPQCGPGRRSCITAFHRSQCAQSTH